MTPSQTKSDIPPIERIAILIIASLFIVFYVSSITTARQFERNQIRAEHVTHIKQAVEGYQNETGHYPAPPSGEATCTRSDDSKSWLFGPDGLLFQVDSTIPSQDFSKSGYRYCAHDPKDGKAQGYFVESKVSGSEKVISRIDIDDDNVIIREKGTTYLRICGGDEPQCMKNDE